MNYDCAALLQIFKAIQWGIIDMTRFKRLSDGVFIFCVFIKKGVFLNANDFIQENNIYLILEGHLIIVFDESNIMKTYCHRNIVMEKSL